MTSDILNHSSFYSFLPIALFSGFFIDLLFFIFIRQKNIIKQFFEMQQKIFCNIDESKIGHALNHAELMGIDCLSKKIQFQKSSCSFIKIILLEINLSAKFEKFKI